jgi:hypothetical protein
MVLKLFDECFFCAEKAVHGNAWRYIGRILRCIIVFFPARIIIVQTFMCIHIHSSNVHVYTYFCSTIKLLSYRVEEIILPRVYHNWNSDLAHHHVSPAPFVSSVHPRLRSSPIVSFFWSDFRGRGQLTTSLPEAG